MCVYFLINTMYTTQESLLGNKLAQEAICKNFDHNNDEVLEHRADKLNKLILSRKKILCRK